MAFFSWVPFFRGHYLNYHEYFALCLLGFTGLLWLISLLVWCCVSQRQKIRSVYRRCANRGKTSALEAPLNSGPTLIDIQFDNSRSVPVQKSSKCSKFQGFLSWFATVFFALFIISFSTFDLLPPPAGAILSFLVLAVRYVISLHDATPSARSARVIEKYSSLPWYKRYAATSFEIIKVLSKQRPLPFWFGLAAFASLTTVLTVFSYGTCICLFNAREGGVTAGPVTLSTWFSRSYLAPPCPNGPCHIYLTMPEETSSAMIVNIHTSSRIAPVTVYYDVVSRAGQPTSAYAYSTVASKFEVPYFESNADRAIHSAKIATASASTIYYFVVDWSDGVTDEKAFSSMPTDNRDITFVNGGDAGVNEITDDMNKQAAKQNPLFAVVGGDIAYSNAMPTCYRAWDSYLSHWESQMVTDQNLMIPILTAVGNHDSGTNSMSQRYTDFDNPPLYFYLFPQELDSNGLILPPTQRKPYHVHKFGTDTVLISLDSGHSVPYDGPQTTWLNQTLQKYASISKKIVTYHVPMYPSTGGYDDVYATAVGQQAWVPLFDQYKVITAMENHVHSFKLTQPLKNGAVDSKGTLYIGDGLWGVDPTKTPMLLQDARFSATAATYHIWKIVVSSSGVTLTGITRDGTVLSGTPVQRSISDMQ
eukprot:GILJ01005752.1.p1 GENE.GILJ01005752.1~~GILJ01005752.1.p1  ORF type:complete len:646 (-),score=69.13 GILJ01005752.1:128-2065(-)